jgi:hypothetical protein
LGRRGERGLGISDFRFPISDWGRFRSWLAARRFLLGACGGRVGQGRLGRRGSVERFEESSGLRGRGGGGEAGEDFVAVEAGDAGPLLGVVSPGGLEDGRGGGFAAALLGGLALGVALGEGVGKFALVRRALERGLERGEGRAGRVEVRGLSRQLGSFQQAKGRLGALDGAAAELGELFARQLGFRPRVSAQGGEPLEALDGLAEPLLACGAFGCGQFGGDAALFARRRAVPDQANDKWPGAEPNGWAAETEAALRRRGRSCLRPRAR